MLRNRPATLLLTALAPAVWGSTYLVTTELLPPDRPLTAAALRALPAGLLLLLITRRLPSGSWWWKSLVLGALNIGIFLALLFVAAYRLPGGLAATVGSVQPLLVVGLSVALLGQRFTLRSLVAALGGIAGVGLLVLRADARPDAIGIAAALGGAVVMASGVVLSKRWAPPAGLLAVTGWQLVTGGLLLAPTALLAEGTPPALTVRNLAGYGYLGLIGAAVAYALWFRGIRALSPTEVTFLGLLSPLVATVLGWLALGQGLTGLQLLGGALALGSVVLAQTRPATAGPRPHRPAHVHAEPGRPDSRPADSRVPTAAD
ncbi:EamA family transporter [Kitasatospora sp. NPDC051914]|uniref:EamA family transporter n=1 Tax=Kitasatospora sp. NPDC051914 TaxID=3154945 RepID=UPI003433B6F4